MSAAAEGVGAPRVTAVVATRNRREAVQTAVGSILAQEGVELEVLVYDDGSEDGTAEALRRGFPEIAVTRSEDHVERLVLRNRGMREARHPFVLVLDDDCYFPEPDVLRRAVALFADGPRTAVVALPLVEPYRPRPADYPWCRARRGDRLRSFLGGASVFRKDAVLAVGGYREFLVHHHEERDLGLRMLDAGWDFLYAGGTPLIHTLHPARDKAQQVRVYARNALLVAWLNHPRGRVGLHMLASSRNMLLRSFRDWPLSVKARGLAEGLGACWRHRGARRPISRAAYERSRALPSHGPERFAGGVDEVPAPCTRRGVEA